MAASGRTRWPTAVPERGPSRMVSLITSTYRRFAGLIAELFKFGIVGAIAAVVDLGGAAYLQGSHLAGPLSAKAASVAAATVVSYLGNRFWTRSEERRVGKECR